MKNLKKLIEYVFTKDDSNVIGKTKINCVVLSENFNDNMIDIIINKKNFSINPEPTVEDLIFFKDDKKYFKVCDVGDCYDYYLLTLFKL